MHCPACKSPLEPLVFHEIEVDQCPVCRGIWLDLGEIDQLLALRRLPHRLVNVEVYREAEVRVPEGHRTCPRCNTFLKLINVDGISLDICSDCKGFFADLGEFKKLDEAADRRAQEQQKPH